MCYSCCLITSFKLRQVKVFSLLLIQSKAANTHSEHSACFSLWDLFVRQVQLHAKVVVVAATATAVA